MPTLRELQEELKKLEENEDKLAAEYKRVQIEGFKKHEICCPDICTEINSQIDHLKNIKEDLIHKKSFANVRTHHLINRAITASEEQTKSLLELRSKLYAKAICNCE